MKHSFNPLGLLALPALAALLYWPTGETGYLGFLGFLVFLHYFWVNPDELFLHTLRRAATAAFLLECIALPLGLILFQFVYPVIDPMPRALGLSFAASVIFFCLYHSLLEWKEMRGMA